MPASRPGRGPTHRTGAGRRGRAGHRQRPSMLPQRETHAVEIAGLSRELPLFQAAPGLRIAVLNILGDTELVQACAVALAQRLKSPAFDLIVTAEAKSIPLAHALSVVMDEPSLLLR